MFLYAIVLNLPYSPVTQDIVVPVLLRLPWSLWITVDRVKDWFFPLCFIPSQEAAVVYILYTFFHFLSIFSHLLFTHLIYMTLCEYTFPVTVQGGLLEQVVCILCYPLCWQLQMVTVMSGIFYLLPLSLCHLDVLYLAKSRTLYLLHEVVLWKSLSEFIFTEVPICLSRTNVILAWKKSSQGYTHILTADKNFSPASNIK